MAELQYQTLTSNECIQLAPHSKCFAVRQYFIGEGFKGTINQHKVNIKRSLSERKSNSYFPTYFNRSISAVAADLAMFLCIPEIEASIDLIIILPSSKKADHSDFNDKSTRLAEALRERVKPPVTSDLIMIHESHESAHLGGSRAISFHRDNFFINPRYNELLAEPKTIFVIDDLITSGGHFEGAKSRLLTSNPTHTIIGLFWARAVEREGSLSLDDIQF